MSWDNAFRMEFMMSLQEVKAELDKKLNAVLEMQAKYLDAMSNLQRGLQRFIDEKDTTNKAA